MNQDQSELSKFNAIADSWWEPDGPFRPLHDLNPVRLQWIASQTPLTGKNVLDIGCGGGFPCVPLAIEFPDMQITGIDSIRKKINSINTIKEKLNLGNLSTICGRVETLKDRKFDVITSRAVGELNKISEYALPLLKRGGYFVAYKSKKAVSEIEDAKKVLNKYNAKVTDILKYTLPLEETYERNLIIISL